MRAALLTSCSCLPIQPSHAGAAELSRMNEWGSDATEQGEGGELVWAHGGPEDGAGVATGLMA